MGVGRESELSPGSLVPIVLAKPVLGRPAVAYGWTADVRTDDAFAGRLLAIAWVRGDHPHRPEGQYVATLFALPHSSLAIWPASDGGDGSDAVGTREQGRAARPPTMSISAERPRGGVG